MTGNSDELTDKPSYGWLFSTITAFGLLLFLALSFTFYHRRIMARRKKEKEYNNFFRFLRPDLENGDKKITRARSILTNTHNLDLSVINNDGYYDNEAFEDDDDSMSNSEYNDSGTKISYAEWAGQRNDGALSKQMEDRHIYIRSVQARKQVLFADVHSDTMFRESESVNDVKSEDDASDKSMSQDDQLVGGENETSVEICKRNTETTTPEIKMNSFSQMQSEENEVFKQSRHKIIAHKPPILKPLMEITSDTDGTLKKKTTLKPIKTKKKKRSLLSHTYKKTAISLDVENRDTSVFYSEPRRSSEPGLFLYNEEAADPQDSKLYDNQNKILFNPYYTDVGMPLDLQQTRRVQRIRSLPVSDDIYDKHVPASTWM